MHTVHPIVAQARTWLGTQFHHQGRLKATTEHKGGVDCLGLLIGVANELGLRERRGGQLLSAYDETDYAWLPSGEALQAKLADVLNPIHVQDIQSGDIALFRLDGNPQHLGILNQSDKNVFTLIHAFAPSRKVVEVQFDDFWRRHLHGVFRVQLTP
jgi:cell wall-associated NlpC family hydrolase